MEKALEELLVSKMGRSDRFFYYHPKFTIFDPLEEAYLFEAVVDTGPLEFWIGRTFHWGPILGERPETAQENAKALIKDYFQDACAKRRAAKVILYSVKILEGAGYGDLLPDATEFARMLR